jgi:hypothetical protein
MQESSPACSPPSCRRHRRLEPQPQSYLPATGRQQREVLVAAIDSSETALWNASGVCYLSREGIVSLRFSQAKPVKEIKELNPNLQIYPLSQAGGLTKSHVFVDETRFPVIRIKWSGGTQGTGCRIGPGVRIQHELLVGIDATAVQILEKQRLARDPAGEGIPKRELVDIVSRDRHLKRLTTRITEDAADIPTTEDRLAESAIPHEARRRHFIAKTEDENMRLVVGRQRLGAGTVEHVVDGNSDATLLTDRSKVF